MASSSPLYIYDKMRMRASKASLSVTDLKKLTHQLSLAITFTEIAPFLMSDLVVIATVWRNSDSLSTRKIGRTKLAVHKRFKI